MKLSLVVPVFNEAECLPLLLKELRAVLDPSGLDYEVIFVDDGSRDASLALLSREAVLDPRLKVLSFSRNFGHQTAVTAGIDFSTGDAVIIMDADLQDPPSLIPEMVRLYQEGYDVVSPQRLARQGDSWLKRGTAALFYWIMRRMVEERIPPEVGDFRLLSRGAVLALRQFREQHRFMRGLIAWLGLREVILPFQRRPRVAGATKYPLRKMLRFSWVAITSFSALPLRLTITLGFAASLLGLAYFLFAAYAALVLKSVVPGWTSLVFLQCFFFGVMLVSLGLIGDYVAKIYEESKGRPLYIIDRVWNIAPESGPTRRVVVLEPRDAPPQP